MAEKKLVNGTSTGNDIGIPGKRSEVAVILGAQWGDEGKGKIVDLLCQSADVVCRCQVLNVSPVGGKVTATCCPVVTAV